jgi:hypothetical protein
VTRREQDELYLLVGQAFELKGSPYFHDACKAIAHWHERRRQARLERGHASIGDLVRLLRETDPARSRRQTA